MLKPVIMTKKQIKEGWSDSIISKTKIHYFKNGVSLCKKAYENKGHRHFEKREGSIYFNDCALCIKKLKTYE